MKNFIGTLFIFLFFMSVGLNANQARRLNLLQEMSRIVINLPPEEDFAGRMNEGRIIRACQFLVEIYSQIDKKTFVQIFDYFILGLASFDMPAFLILKRFGLEDRGNLSPELEGAFKRARGIVDDFNKEFKKYKRSIAFTYENFLAIFAFATINFPNPPIDRCNSERWRKTLGGMDLNFLIKLAPYGGRWKSLEDLLDISATQHGRARVPSF